MNQIGKGLTFTSNFLNSLVSEEIYKYDSSILKDINTLDKIDEMITRKSMTTDELKKLIYTGGFTHLGIENVLIELLYLGSKECYKDSGYLDVFRYAIKVLEKDTDLDTKIICNYFGARASRSEALLNEFLITMKPDIRFDRLQPIRFSIYRNTNTHTMTFVKYLRNTYSFDKDYLINLLNILIEFTNTLGDRDTTLKYLCDIKNNV